MACPVEPGHAIRPGYRSAIRPVRAGAGDGVFFTDTSLKFLIGHTFKGSDQCSKIVRRPLGLGIVSGTHFLRQQSYTPLPYIDCRLNIITTRIAAPNNRVRGASSRACPSVRDPLIFVSSGIGAIRSAFVDSCRSIDWSGGLGAGRFRRRLRRIEDCAAGCRATSVRLKRPG
jgi:hypothetical protein